MPRGKVKHVIYDPGNPEHVKIAKKLGADLSVNDSIARGELGMILQFFEGKPSGFVEFSISKKFKEAFVSYVFVKEELRDTIRSEKKVSAKELSEKFEKIKKGSKIGKRDQTRLRSITRAESGLRRRDKQLLLGVKLVKSINTKTGLMPLPMHGKSPQGIKYLQKYPLGRLKKRR